MQERHNGEQEESLRREAEERPEQEPEEAPEARFERIVERGTAIVEEIAQYGSGASGEDAGLEERRTSAVEVLDEETVAEIEEESQVHERLELIGEQQRALAGNTLEKVRALTDLLLSDELNDDEREEVYERLGLEKLGSGSYFKAHEIPGTEWVFKPLKLNYLHSREDAVRILGAQSEEESRLREHFGDMVPETTFIYPEEYKDVFEEGSARAEQGKFPYGLGNFVKIMAEKRLDPGYTPKDVQDAEREGLLDRAMGPIGEFLKKTPIYRQEAAGAALQERIHGITFAEFFERYDDFSTCPNAEKLQKSVGEFIQGVRSFNEAGNAFCILSFETDNTLVEIDPESGEPTGNIKIPDINYTQRPSERMRQHVNEKTEEQILGPLEERFGLRSVGEGETTTQRTE